MRLQIATTVVGVALYAHRSAAIRVNQGRTNRALDRRSFQSVRRFLALLFVVTVGPPEGLATWPKFHTLPELIAFSDVVALAEFVRLDESRPERRYLGGLYRDVAAVVRFNEYVRQSPFVHPSLGDTNGVQFERTEFDQSWKTGQYLVFLRQRGPRQYVPVGAPHGAMFRIDEEDCLTLFPTLLSNKADCNRALKLSQVRKMISAAVVPDQDQTLAVRSIGVSRTYESQSSARTFRRLDLTTQCSPGRSSPELEEYFRFDVAGYCEERSLNLPTLVRRIAEGGRGLRVVGEWRSGYFMIRDIVDPVGGEHFVTPGPSTQSETGNDNRGQH